MTHPAVTSLPVRLAGLDVGDRKSHLYVVDQELRVVERDSFPTTREALTKTFGRRPRCRVVLEAGSQSPWMAALLRELGHLRRFGLRLCERGGRAAKRRAAVAVARRPAVLLHRLCVSGEPYEPLRHAARA